MLAVGTEEPECVRLRRDGCAEGGGGRPASACASDDVAEKGTLLIAGETDGCGAGGGAA